VCEPGGKATVQRCNFWSFADLQRGRPSVCVRVRSGGEAVVEGNTLLNSFGPAIEVHRGGKAEISGNALNSDVRRHHTERGIQLQPGAEVTITGSRGPGAKQVYLGDEQVNPDGTRPGDGT